ncbi:unnamed protein product [Rotaria sp. Silwood2]|nr:unnamed protein product [Rotaria sp. Silwood2]
MSREEIEKFKEDDDFLINSFFSTTLDRKIALFFISLTDPKEGFERVLLEIKIDIKLHTRPYADISKLHYCKGESEVLFMIGTKLKLRSKKPYWNENEKIWIIQLELCPIQQDSEKNKVPDESMRKSLKKHVNKLLNPWLYVVLEPKDMQEIFNALVDFYPNETWIDATRIHCQAKILQWRFENFYEALELYDEALYKWTLYLEDEEIDCMADIAELEANFAECYRENTMFANMHYDSAISYYKLALEKETNQEEKMNIYYKMSSVYEAKIQACSYDEDNEKDREEKVSTGCNAIRHQEHIIEQLSSQHPINEEKIAQNRLVLGSFCWLIDKYDEAIQHYSTALEVFLTNVDLKGHSTVLSRTLERLVNMYVNHKHDYQLGLKYQLMMHEYILKENVIDETDNQYCRDSKKYSIATSHMKLADIYAQCQLYTEMKEQLLISMRLRQETSKINTEKIADIETKLVYMYIKTNQPDAAYEHSMVAINLYEECKKRLEKDKDSDKAAIFEEKISTVYEQLNMYDEAIERLLTAQNLYKTERQRKEDGLKGFFGQYLEYKRLYHLKMKEMDTNIKADQRRLEEISARLTPDSKYYAMFTS